MSLVLCTALLSAAANTGQVLDQADDYHELKQHNEVIALLESNLGGAANRLEQAEILWRLSRAYLGLADERDDAGAADSEVLSLYEKGEDYGKRAMQADSNNPWGYYWASANIGKWGQKRGILQSLFKASDMRDLLIQAIDIDPGHSDSYFVLAQLYAAVPGFGSFGNNDYAVSLARLAVDLGREQVRNGERENYPYAFTITLAENLENRGWNQRRRDREQSSKQRDYNRADTPLRRGWFYEGSLQIPAMSDNDEAKKVLDDMIREIERLPNPRIHDLDDLDKAREVRASL